MEGPTRTIFNGDDSECFLHLGNARRVMHILENRMELGGLDQLSMRVYPRDDVEIKCSKMFGQKTIEITVGRKVEEVKPPMRECLCGCNFTTGWVMEVQPDQLEDDGSTLYTVAACFKGERYIVVKDVLASDHTQYDTGWPVLMIPYIGMSFLCCSATDGSGGSTGCRPMKSTELITSDNWRTTYRIVPWCALAVPRWRQKNG